MKILVRAPNWVGDAVIAIPALEAIRHARPGAEISVLARPAVADLFFEQPFADRVMTFDWRGPHQGLRGRESLIRELRREKFDVAVLLQNAFEGAWIAWRAGIPERIGYSRDARGPLLTNAVPVPVKGTIPPHEAFYYLELLRRVGWVEALPAAILPIRFCIPAAARQAAESALQRAGSRENSWRVAIAPGASYGAAKCWPVERFAQLADRLISESGAGGIFFGTEFE